MVVVVVMEVVLGVSQGDKRAGQPRGGQEFCWIEDQKISARLARVVVDAEKAWHCLVVYGGWLEGVVDVPHGDRDRDRDD